MAPMGGKELHERALSFVNDPPLRDEHQLAACIDALRSLAGSSEQMKQYKTPWDVHKIAAVIASRLISSKSFYAGMKLTDAMVRMPSVAAAQSSWSDCHNSGGDGAAVIAQLSQQALRCTCEVFVAADGAADSSDHEAAVLEKLKLFERSVRCAMHRVCDQGKGMRPLVLHVVGAVGAVIKKRIPQVASIGKGSSSTSLFSAFVDFLSLCDDADAQRHIVPLACSYISSGWNAIRRAMDERLKAALSALGIEAGAALFDLDKSRSFSEGFPLDHTAMLKLAQCAGLDDHHAEATGAAQLLKAGFESVVKGIQLLDRIREKWGGHQLSTPIVPQIVNVLQQCYSIAADFPSLLSRHRDALRSFLSWYLPSSSSSSGGDQMSLLRAFDAFRAMVSSAGLVPTATDYVRLLRRLMGRGGDIVTTHSSSCASSSTASVVATFNEFLEDGVSNSTPQFITGCLAFARFALFEGLYSGAAAALQPIVQRFLFKGRNGDPPATIPSIFGTPLIVEASALLTVSFCLFGDAAASRCHALSALALSLSSSMGFTRRNVHLALWALECYSVLVLPSRIYQHTPCRELVRCVSAKDDDPVAAAVLTRVATAPAPCAVDRHSSWPFAALSTEETARAQLGGQEPTETVVAANVIAEWRRCSEALVAQRGRHNSTALDALTRIIGVSFDSQLRCRRNLASRRVCTSVRDIPQLAPTTAAALCCSTAPVSWLDPKFMIVQLCLDSSGEWLYLHRVDNSTAADTYSSSSNNNCGSGSSSPHVCIALPVSCDGHNVILSAKKELHAVTTEAAAHAKTEMTARPQDEAKEQKRERRRIWWDARFEFNRRIGSVVTLLHETLLGPWRALLVGSPLDQFCRRSLRTHLAPRVAAELSTWAARVFRAAAAEKDLEEDVLLLAPPWSVARPDVDLIYLLLSAVPWMDGVDSTVSVTFAPLGDGPRDLGHRACSEELAAALLDLVPDASAALDRLEDPSDLVDALRSLAFSAFEDATTELLQCSSCRDGDSSTTVERQHVFMVLDESLHILPWEGLPELRTQSVSRVPSFAFVESSLNEKYHQRSNVDSGLALLRTGIDKGSVFFVLNPNGDMERSEKTLRSVIDDPIHSEWRGLVRSVAQSTGPHPATITRQRSHGNQDVLSELARCDLYLFVGHNTGETFIHRNDLWDKGTVIRSVALLMGCSSAAMKGGTLKGLHGMPHSYLQAGCPLLVGCLWDVTDGDIDRFTKQLLLDLFGASQSEPLADTPSASAGDEFSSNFAKISISEYQQHHRGTWSSLGGDCSPLPCSIPAAVAHARSVCKLPFLTAASVVCYGLPVCVA